MEKLRVLDLFSGIGGFSLGLERTGGFETVAFCEIEEFPRKVLAKHWPEVFCHKDVRTLTKETLWHGYAENAVLTQLCRETRGNLVSVRSAIENIRESAAGKTQTSTTSGPLDVDEALLTIMAESAPAAVKESTHFWPSITLTTTAARNAKSTNVLLGRLLSREDFQAVIKFFVTIATWRKPSTEHARMKAAMGSSIYEDVRTLTADILDRDGIGQIDVITGGFPCQDLSLAGKQAGMGEGTRSGLWSEIVRLVGELRPRFVIVENVANLLSGPSTKRGGWFGRVLGDLAECGYNAEWENIPAAAVGAPHRRERVWIIAYPNQNEHTVGLVNSGNSRKGLRGQISHLTKGCPSLRERLWPDIPCGHKERVGETWLDRVLFSGGGVPAFVGVGDGLRSWMDRDAALGNAVVPQIPELIGHAILEAIR